jgi:putative heme iron utilization protein
VVFGQIARLIVDRERSFTGTEARQLVRRARTGTLASLNRDDGIPYASLVNVATDVEGRPLILVSALAWHTKNLSSDPRASLLVAEPPASGDALTGPRATVMGRFSKVEDKSLERRYLARHPQAALYARFGDFAFWRLEPERVHAVAGFGRIETMETGEVFPSNPEMIGLEEGAIQHMNDDHGAAVRLYAAKLLGAEDGEWKVQALDADGCDLVLAGHTLRLAFDKPVSGAAELRNTLAALSARARALAS